MNKQIYVYGDENDLKKISDYIRNFSTAKVFDEPRLLGLVVKGPYYHLKKILTTASEMPGVSVVSTRFSIHKKIFLTDRPYLEYNREFQEQNEKQG